MTDEGPRIEPRRDLRERKAPWGLIASLVLVLVALGGFYWAFTKVTSVPGEIARGGEAVAERLGEIARAFNQKRVTHLFTSYATEIEGTTRLQVATLTETEVFGLREEASTLWGVLELPTVAVSATAPVTYTYYLDLEGDWDFVLDEGRKEVLVMAPPLRFNKPAIDASRIRYDIEQGHLLRDERTAAARLKRELAGRTYLRARENIDLVRETARGQVERFVRTWLIHQFEDAEDYGVEAYFSDEAPAWEAEVERL